MWTWWRQTIISLGQHGETGFAEQGRLDKAKKINHEKSPLKAGMQRLAEDQRAMVSWFAALEKEATLSNVDRGRQKLIKELSHRSLALPTQIETGHSYLRDHLWFKSPEGLNGNGSPICGMETYTPRQLYKCPPIFYLLSYR